MRQQSQCCELCAKGKLFFCFLIWSLGIGLKLCKAHYSESQDVTCRSLESYYIDDCSLYGVSSKENTWLWNLIYSARNAIWTKLDVAMPKEKTTEWKMLFWTMLLRLFRKTEWSIISTDHMCDSSVLPWAKTAFKHVCQHFLGAFLVPYVLFLLSCGIPMFLMETAMGQFTSQGCITCWRYFCPLFEGQCVARLIQTEILRHNSHSPPYPDFT